MTFEGFERIGDIGSLATTAEEVSGLLSKARRKLTDSRVPDISKGTRLEQAYNAILTCAMISLRASGYRVLNITARHYVTLETLRFTIGINLERVEYFQSLRNLRHDDVYSASVEVSDIELREAIKESEKLLVETEGWLARNHPDLLL
jgi:hypothetical protein